MITYDKMLEKLTKYHSEIDEFYEIEKNYVKDKTDDELIKMMNCGITATALGKRKAAIEELQRRGVIES